ncbi:MAG: ATP-binding protein [Bacteroidetes bacterium]|nr:ATP-binding protein [Bacteroidota bacterium]
MTQLYTREIVQSLEKWMDSREILIIYGTRQVGKSTLLDMLLGDRNDAVILNCERPLIFEILQSRDLSKIKALFGDKRIIALDEAQSVTGIGQTLKLVYDEEPGYKLIVTGSSSFELSDRITEPLTGRNIKFRLYPLSVKEIMAHKSWLWIMENLKELIAYGCYPGIIDLPVEKKKIKLEEMVGDYLFKDILIHEGIKQSGLLFKLLQLIAYQIGNLTSAHELSKELGVSVPTINRFLDLLEKTFVIYPLSSYSSNLRNEIRKSKKYYFYDTGICNAVIGNFGLIDNQKHVGSLWENFCVSERIKFNQIHNRHAKLYFWRTYDGAEVDLVEVFNGNLNTFEFKWNARKKPSLPTSFKEKYHKNTFQVIHPGNFQLLFE